jgi:hypothetical protein
VTDRATFSIRLTGLDVAVRTAGKAVEDAKDAALASEKASQARGEARRQLSKAFERVTWPPREGARIHYNSGWSMTSWTAEVRSIVDDEVAVIFETAARGGRSTYALLTRTQVDVWKLRYGPLPAALKRES